MLGSLPAKFKPRVRGPQTRSYKQEESAFQAWLNILGFDPGPDAPARGHRPRALSGERSPTLRNLILVQAAGIYHGSDLYRCIATVEDALEKGDVRSSRGHDFKSDELLVDTRSNLQRLDLPINLTILASRHRAFYLATHGMYLYVVCQPVPT